MIELRRMYIIITGGMSPARRMGRRDLEIRVDLAMTFRSASYPPGDEPREGE